MKKYILLALILLTACSQPLFSNQNVLEIKQEKNITEPVIQEADVPEPAQIQPKQTPIKVTGAFEIRANAENDTYLVKNDEVVIELVDVDEDAEGCLIRVDGVTDFVLVDGEAVINGWEINVFDAIAIRSFMEDKDLCRISARPTS